MTGASLSQPRCCVNGCQRWVRSSSASAAVSMAADARAITGRKQAGAILHGRMGKRRRLPLELLVFVVGSATLGSEIAVARLIAPFFGDSTIVWANTIAVVLVALSIGYWFGGRMADRHPQLDGLCMLVLASAGLLGAAPFLSPPLLYLLGAR